MTAHIFTIDVEDWFHIPDLENTPLIDWVDANETKLPTLPDQIHVSA